MKHIFLFILLFSFLVYGSKEDLVYEISYGTNQKQKIDFYRGDSKKVLVWIHGGGWLYGDKRADRWIRRFENHFIDYKNLNLYMIGYRVGEATAPNAVDDVICAYKKIVDEVILNGFSKDDIVVAGASAGGHLALMLAFSNNYINQACSVEVRPKAIINLFGITDIEKTYTFLDKTKFFKASNYVKGWIPPEASLFEVSKRLSPINLIDKNAPDILTIHGTSDRWVPYEQALLLEESLGEKHQLLTIEGGGHYYFSDEEDELIRQTISSFLEKNYKNKSEPS